MELLMLCGSPRYGKGAEGCCSLYLLEQLKARLGQGKRARILPANPAGDLERLAQALAGCQALVLAFPLYVDSVPAGLLETMEALERRLAERSEPGRIPLYPIVNCGFYEGGQNRLAVSMVWAWAEHCGLRRGRALAVGGGEMVRAAPLGRGPLTSLGKNLDRLAQDIQTGAAGETLWTQPDFPRPLYQLAGNLGFRRQGRKNGLSARQIKGGR